MTAKRSGASVQVTPSGPYVVEGVPLQVKAPIRTELGEPVAWEVTGAIETPTTYALCRCGGSQNKPFCDGSHVEQEWDGTETAATSSYDERAKPLGGTGVSVRDDRSLCEHAGFCGTRLTNVWQMAADSHETATRSQMMAMIERCPSGALTYATSDVSPDVEPDLAVAISVTPDGPLALSGGIEVKRADGAPFETRNRVTLCRCGASKSKPLCDGSHAEIAFTDTPAVADAATPAVRTGSHAADLRPEGPS